MRKDWHIYFLEIADKVAERATCNKKQVGAVLVKDNYIVSTGYNGSDHGQPHCIDVGCLLDEKGKCIRTLHAEDNALRHARKEDIPGSILYCTNEPCPKCTELLKDTGIITVYFTHAYKDDRSSKLRGDIEWIHIDRE